MKTISFSTVYSYCLVAVLGFALLSCGRSLQVNYDYDSSVNLKQFKTFKVEAEKRMEQDPLLGSELNRQRLRDAIVQAMVAKGYKLTDDNPELTIKFLTDVKERQQIRNNNNYSPYMWWYGPGFNNNYSSYSYQESRFIINIYQAESRQMIWQGWAAGRAKEPSKKSNTSEVVKNIIADILISFPTATLDSYGRN